MNKQQNPQDNVIQWIEDHQDEIAAFLQDLVRNPQRDTLV